MESRLLFWWIKSWLSPKITFIRVTNASYIHAHPWPYIHTQTHICTHTYKYTHVNTHAHAHTHTHTYTHTTHTQVHAYTQVTTRDDAIVMTKFHDMIFMSWHRKFMIIHAVACNKWLDNRRKVNNYENTVVNGIAL